MAWLQIDEMVENQASKYLTHNTANRKLRVLTQLVIVDRDLTEPPGSPADGSCYIPASVAAGSWAGYEDYIAFYSTNSWVFLAPSEGWLAYIQDENVFLKYDGSSWVAMSGSMDASTLNGFDEDDFVLRDPEHNVFLGSESSASPSAVESTNTLHVEAGTAPSPLAGHGQYFSGEISSAVGIGPMMQNERGDIWSVYTEAAVDDATGSGDAHTQLNSLLAKLRAIGIISS